MGFRYNLKTLSCIIIFLSVLLNSYLTEAQWNIETVDGMFTSVGSDTSLVLDNDDNPHISYQDGSNDNLKYAFYNGSTWQTTTVDSPDNVGRRTSITLDNSGNPHISYYDDTNDNLKYAQYNDFSGWMLETVDDTGTGVGFPASTIALDSSGNPHIFYGDHFNGAYKYARFNGADWDIETVRTSGDSTPFNSFVLNSSGNPCFSYYAYGQLYYGYYDGIWNTGLVDSGPEVGPFNCLTLDSSGNPHISYYDHTNGDLKYAYYYSTWHIETIDSEGDVGYYTSIALDRSGNPHISYYDDTNDNLKYACYDGTWHVDTIDSEGNVGWHNSLALDSSGNPHISYYDVTNGDLKYAYYEPPACIATLIYGKESEEVNLLRFFRDKLLNYTPKGKAFIKLYYEWSPLIVKAMENDKEFKKAVKKLINELLPSIKEVVN